IDLLLPPVRFLCSEHPSALFGIIAVLPNKLEPGFLLRQHPAPDIQAEESTKPEIFTQTLMNHLLSDAAASRVLRVWARIQVLVAEHAPDAQNLEALG